MKRKIIISLVTVLVCLSMASTASAETKIATVSMRKLLDKYYKKSVAEQALKEKEESYNKDGKAMMEEFRTKQEEYDKALSASYDQAVTPSEREKRKLAAESKLSEVQTLQKSIQTFQSTANEQLETLKRRMLDKIIEEIRAAVNAKAKSNGYSLVLDASGESISQVPLVLYSSGESDITDDVLTQLNALAPASSGSPAPASGKK